MGGSMGGTMGVPCGVPCGALHAHREHEEEHALRLVGCVQVLDRDQLGDVRAREEVSDRVALGEEDEGDGHVPEQIAWYSASAQ